MHSFLSFNLVISIRMLSRLLHTVFLHEYASPSRLANHTLLTDKPSFVLRDRGVSTRDQARDGPLVPAWTPPPPPSQKGKAKINEFMRAIKIGSTRPESAEGERASPGPRASCTGPRPATVMPEMHFHVLICLFVGCLVTQLVWNINVF